MDGVGLPLFKALPIVHGLLVEEDVREQVKLLASGKLIDTGVSSSPCPWGSRMLHGPRLHAVSWLYSGPAVQSEYMSGGDHHT